MFIFISVKHTDHIIIGIQLCLLVGRSKVEWQFSGSPYCLRVSPVSSCDRTSVSRSIYFLYSTRLGSTCFLHLEEDERDEWSRVAVNEVLVINTRGHIGCVFTLTN